MHGSMHRKRRRPFPPPLRSARARKHKGSWYPDCPVSFGVCHSSSMGSGKPSSCSRAVREYLLSKPSVDRPRTGVPDHVYLFGTRRRMNYVRITPESKLIDFAAESWLRTWRNVFFPTLPPASLSQNFTNSLTAL